MGVPRNIRCSNRCAKPDLPGSTSLRSRVDDDVDRDDVGESGRDGDQAESVREFFLGVGERENFLGSVCAEETGYAGQQQNGEQSCHSTILVRRRLDAVEDPDGERDDGPDERERSTDGNAD